MKQYLDLMVLDSRIGTEYPMPAPATPGSAGVDLRAMSCKQQLPRERADWFLSPGERAMFGTGLAVHIAVQDVTGIVASRSGLSLERGLRVAQGIGVIDSDYQKEIGVILHNDSDEIARIEQGERIAQLLLMPVLQPMFQVVDDFAKATARTGGFGHTGRV
ncbi:MAG: dUTP diphosphatase [Halomonas sp.]